MPAMREKTTGERYSEHVGNYGQNVERTVLGIRSAWEELISDPGVFSLLARDLAGDDVDVVEIHNMEPDLRSNIPGDEEVYGLILLFPYRNAKNDRNLREYFKKQREKFEENAIKVDSMFFARQIVPNSCATHALLSILLNSPSLPLNDMLSRFKEFTAGMTPENKGYAIGNQPEFAAFHNLRAPMTLSAVSTVNDAATASLLRLNRPNTASGKRSATRSTTEVINSFHFVPYVPVKGELMELDGLKDYPVNHRTPQQFFADRDPPVSNPDWMDQAQEVIKARMKHDTDKVNYVLLGLKRSSSARFHADLELTRSLQHTKLEQILPIFAKLKSDGFCWPGVCDELFRDLRARFDGEKCAKTDVSSSVIVEGLTALRKRLEEIIREINETPIPQALVEYVSILKPEMRETKLSPVKVDEEADSSLINYNRVRGDVARSVSLPIILRLNTHKNFLAKTATHIQAVRNYEKALHQPLIPPRISGKKVPPMVEASPSSVVRKPRKPTMPKKMSFSIGLNGSPSVSPVKIHPESVVGKQNMEMIGRVSVEPKIATAKRDVEQNGMLVNGNPLTGSGNGTGAVVASGVQKKKAVVGRKRRRRKAANSRWQKKRISGNTSMKKPEDGENFGRNLWVVRKGRKVAVSAKPGAKKVAVPVNQMENVPRSMRARTQSLVKHTPAEVSKSETDLTNNLSSPKSRKSRSAKCEVEIVSLDERPKSSVPDELEITSSSPLDILESRRDNLRKLIALLEEYLDLESKRSLLHQKLVEENAKRKTIVDDAEIREYDANELMTTLMQRLIQHNLLVCEELEALLPPAAKKKPDGNSSESDMSCSALPKSRAKTATETSRKRRLSVENSTTKKLHV